MGKKKTKKKKTKPAKQQPEIKPVPPNLPSLPPSGRIPSFEETIAEQKAKQAAEPQRSRGRPRKEQPAEPEPGPELTDTAIKAGIKIPFNLWAEANQLDKLKLEDNEVQELAAAIKGLVDFYCPNVPVPVLLWGNATLTLAAILTPRLEKINKIKKEKEKAAAARGPSRATGPGTAPAVSDKFPSVDEIHKKPSG